jgi:hypothetical protein
MRECYICSSPAPDTGFVIAKCANCEKKWAPAVAKKPALPPINLDEFKVSPKVKLHVFHLNTAFKDEARCGAGLWKQGNVSLYTVNCVDCLSVSVKRYHPNDCAQGNHSLKDCCDAFRSLQVFMGEMYLWTDGKPCSKEEFKKFFKFK